MAWDNVPWFVGGGALHSPEVARTLAYAATSGAEGVVETGDLKVSALATPGTSVRVAPGAVLVRSRAVGGERQTYAGRLATEDTVAISATTSAGPRSDLIVARVEDPFMAGEPWADPADVTVGPYIFTRVISNVPNTTKTVAELGLGYSAVALARIDIPASTATITDSLIVPLAKVARPRRDRSTMTAQSTGGPSAGAVDSLTSTTYVTWPSAASWSVAVPEWATRAIVRADVTSYVVKSANANGTLRLNLGGVASTEVGSYDENYTGSPFRNGLTVVASIAIGSALRGTTQTVKIEGRRSSGTGYLDADLYTSSILDIEFLQEA